jgi:hypothetical protein
MRESAIVVYNQEVVSVSTGTAASVEFDFEALWPYAKSDKEKESSISGLYFYHVHPRGFLELSNMDVNCIQGLLLALGKSFLFSILEFEKDDLIDTSYFMKTFLCENNNGVTDMKNILDCDYHNEGVFLTLEHVHLLKKLAYGNSDAYLAIILQ